MAEIFGLAQVREEGAQVSYGLEAGYTYSDLARDLPCGEIRAKWYWPGFIVWLKLHGLIKALAMLRELNSGRKCTCPHSVEHCRCGENHG